MAQKSLRNYRGVYELLLDLKAIRATFDSGIEVGWPAGTPLHILERVNYMEYNPSDRGEPWAVIQKTTLGLFNTLSDVMQAGLDQGLLGNAFWNHVGDYVEDQIRLTMLGLNTPALLPRTLEIKRELIAQGLAPAAKRLGEDKIFFRTGESFNSIHHKIKNASFVSSSIYVG